MGLRHVIQTLLVVLILWPATGWTQPTAKPSIVRGLVLSQSGTTRNGVAVRLTPRFGARALFITVTGADGTYEFPSVPPGDYRTDILGDGFIPFGAVVTVPEGAQVTHNIVSSQRWGGTLVLVLTTVVLFAAGILAYRHHNIVHTTRELLIAQLENIETRLPLETDSTPGGDERKRAAVDALLVRIRAIKESVPHHLGWIEWFFWSRGHEISGWVRLHEVERQVVAFLVPETRVVERAVGAEAHLREIKKSSAIALADRMRTTLQQIFAAGAGGADAIVPVQLIDHLRQQLAEGLALLHNEADTGFSGLMEWHNKAMWLVYLSLLGILVLGLVFGHEELFIIGAVGGLMSRMARTLFRADVPTDYGASWTTLFLSPLLGAISAWVGIALLAWLHDVQMLGPQFRNLSWDGASTVWVIALGFTLGFSERLFTSLLSKVEGKVTDDLARPAQAPSPGPILPALAPPAPNGASLPAAGQPPVPAPTERILAELDVQRGERVAFIGDAASRLRQELVQIAGAEAVLDATHDTLGGIGPLDAVLFEATPTIAELTAAAGQLAQALRPDGRIVVLGRSTTVLFDADAAAQRANEHLGPALVHEVLLAAGFSSQEPPVALKGTDTIDWLVCFLKPATSGGDR